MRELTGTQKDLLLAMQAGVVVGFAPYTGRFNPNAYYWRWDNYKKCSQAARRLIDRGLAKQEGGYSKEKLVLTQAGKDWKPCQP